MNPCERCEHMHYKHPEKQPRSFCAKANGFSRNDPSSSSDEDHWAQIQRRSSERARAFRKGRRKIKARKEHEKTSDAALWSVDSENDLGEMRTGPVLTRCNQAILRERDRMLHNKDVWFSSSPISSMDGKWSSRKCMQKKISMEEGSVNSSAVEDDYAKKISRETSADALPLHIAGTAINSEPCGCTSPTQPQNANDWPDDGEVCRFVYNHY
ncbi:uncharacterized protein LOC129703543 [Leucoraja erinacea]|uniref:uncharacterized protein LOC129703543 n=1 Tax=Leucoraja erinaceus TaxID=7782 RepID=UPI0024539727|nr:uncharacterized protein LOC129703543 [Leucoraja erinacea]